MKSLIENFAEQMEADAKVSSFSGTETKAKESPDKLSNCVQRMGKTLTEAKEAPDRAFIPNRIL
jgi:hypothetical protein